MATVSLPPPIKSTNGSHRVSPRSSPTPSSSPKHRPVSPRQGNHCYFPPPNITNYPTSPYHRPVSPLRWPVSPHCRPVSPHRRPVSPNCRPASPKYPSSPKFTLSPAHSWSDISRLSPNRPSSPDPDHLSLLKPTPQYPSRSLKCAVCQQTSL